MNQKMPVLIILILVAVLIGVIAFQVIFNQPSGPLQSEWVEDMPASSIEPTNSPTPGKMIMERSGPFQIGFLTTQKIFVDILCKSNDPGLGFDRKEAFGMNIVAANGIVLYSEEYPNGYITLSVRPVPLPNNQGAILLVVPHHFNYVEGTGQKQFLGFRQDGSFGPITRSIGEMEAELTVNDEGLRIIEYKEKERVVFCCVGYSASGNFTVVRYLPLYFNGAYETSPQFIELGEYPVSIDEAKAAKLRKDGTVHLYKAALLKAENKILKVRRDSKVKFLGAKRMVKEDLAKVNKDVDFPYVEWWLHVIIDGEEGYIVNRKELVTLGLEFQPRDLGDLGDDLE